METFPNFFFKKLSLCTFSNSFRNYAVLCSKISNSVSNPTNLSFKIFPNPFERSYGSTIFIFPLVNSIN